ncbi:MAG: hypothetical protein K0S41_2814 [Anaerocolumna sp.]|jgi:hypothetical protein|nr:hypothetical protein [Anaerocolumna sp.]
MSNMSDGELLLLFHDCMGTIYQQMVTRHKLHCTFKESLYPNMPDIGDELSKLLIYLFKFIAWVPNYLAF